MVGPRIKVEPKKPTISAIETELNTNVFILCFSMSFLALFNKLVQFYTEDFSQGVMVSCNGFFLMLSVVKCRQITSTVINYHVGWTISRYVT